MNGAAMDRPLFDPKHSWTDAKVNERAPGGVYGVAAMSKELLLVVDAVANEKGVPREVIFEALEAALASAAKKRYPEEDPDIHVSIDRDTGDYETFRRWEIIADDGEMESPFYQLRLMDALDEREGAEVGEYIETQIENAEFGRIAEIGRASCRERV